MDRVDILKGLSRVIDFMDDDCEGCITHEDAAAVRASINKSITEQNAESIRSKAFIEGYRSAMMDVLNKVI